MSLEELVSLDPRMQKVTSGEVVKINEGLSTSLESIWVTKPEVNAEEKVPSLSM